MLSSDPTGTGTKIATSGAAAVTVVSNPSGERCVEVQIGNGPVEACFTVNGADANPTWFILEANVALTLDFRHSPIAALVKVKRIGATDATGIRAHAY